MSGQAARLRRDLGTVQSYAALLGILIGAGIFRVTTEIGALTGPSVILAYILLTIPVLATSVGYCVFLSTPLGTEPGGEYLHISRTFGGYRVAFVGAWLKAISYLGALAYLANAQADYIIQISGGFFDAARHRLPLALGGLVFFYLVHLVGVRWFGRIQVAMCALLGLALVVLVVPGLTAIRPSNYRPFFTHGASGFFAALPPLFFAYAGFESLAQTAGEVKDSRRRLPGIFLKGILGTAAIFILMSVVAFGVLPMERLQASNAPMAEVASVYLPAGAALFVNLGAIMALATSLNATLLVPSRLGIMLSEDGLAPRWLGHVSPATGTPILGLTLTLAIAALLLISGQMTLALTIAVFALILLYFLHSFALLVLPQRNPALFQSITAGIPLSVQRIAAIVSMITIGGLILLQVHADVLTLSRSSFLQRVSEHSLTSLELAIFWGALGLLMYRPGRRRQA
ncbi:MAG TPA: APC family permease [Patescibacteria group bacterium]|nr:APC family permease [Patescibacteria group bacterium]